MLISGAQLALVKAAGYRKKTGTDSVLRKVFGPYIRQIILGNTLECVFLFITYVPYLCLQKILELIERDQRNAKVASLYATIAILCQAVPGIGNIKLWDL